MKGGGEVIHTISLGFVDHAATNYVKICRYEFFFFFKLHHTKPLPLRVR